MISGIKSAAATLDSDAAKEVKTQIHVIFQKSTKYVIFYKGYGYASQNISETLSLHSLQGKACRSQN
jgi:hypothetical protein